MPLGRIDVTPFSGNANAILSVELSPSTLVLVARLLVLVDQQLLKRVVGIKKVNNFSSKK